MAACTNRALDTLARTVYGEARGEDAIGRKAVAHVILNRVRKGGWWGSNITEVCLFAKQFSCWNDGDPNRVLMMSVDSYDPVFRECLYAALSALRDEENDPTEGANHYHNLTVTPSWAKDKPFHTIGNHKFYKL